MKLTKFQKMKDIEHELEMNDLEIGDIFLYGRHVINQKQSKNVGDPISYYKVISKEGNSVSYGMEFDTLEAD